MTEYTNVYIMLNRQDLTLKAASFIKATVLIESHLIFTQGFSKTVKKVAREERDERPLNLALGP